LLEARKTLESGDLTGRESIGVGVGIVEDELAEHIRVRLITASRPVPATALVTIELGGVREVPSTGQFVEAEVKELLRRRIGLLVRWILHVVSAELIALETVALVVLVARAVVASEQVRTDGVLVALVEPLLAFVHEAVAIPVPIPVSVSISIPISVSIPVSVSTSISVSVSIAGPIPVPISVSHPVAVAIPVPVAVPVATTISITVSITVSVTVSVAVAVSVPVTVSVSERVALALGSEIRPASRKKNDHEGRRRPPCLQCHRA
jgi:hypothetical protein